MISIKNIKKYYTNNDDSTVVLEDISLEVEKTEIVTIYGNSGVGKSTLLSIISGMLKPDCGTIQIKGMDLNQKNTLSIRRKYLGILFQDTILFSIIIPSGDSIRLYVKLSLSTSVIVIE